MKRVALLCAATIAALTLNSTFADDYNPAPWRTNPPGQSPTTHQIWDFLDGTLPAACTVDNNPFGAGSVSITEPATRLWLSSDAGRTGVWKFEGIMEIDVPNYPQGNPLKEIWLQLTYYMDNADVLDPLVYTDPAMSEIQLIHKEQILSSLYWQATYQIDILPNPSSETIKIEPRDCTFYMDQVVVDTICTPEPASVMLLGLGAIGLLKRRKA